jgi:dihydrodipicolinate synthase/N-acetylneuraminate lyase
MSVTDSVSQQRSGLIARIFNGPVPPLWCPALTHYLSDGSIDRGRITAHLRHISKHVGGFLIPGSTGDGWELDQRETQEITEIAIAAARELKRPLLIGVLKADASDAVGEIRKWVARLTELTGRQESAEAMRAAGVSGFAVCPPRGEHLTQQALTAGLSSILETGLPMALYQLPQVTKNEMSAEIVAGLASRYPNFILFKDSSGQDRVAMSGRDLGGVFMMRGAENDYARWSRANGGPYDGYLLSTANCFARGLAEMIAELQSGRAAAAAQISEPISKVVGEVFELVQGLPHGNAFANANKAVDHFMAHGPGDGQVLPPILHAGESMPAQVITRTGEALKRHKLMPSRGYLEV